MMRKSIVSCVATLTFVAGPLCGQGVHELTPEESVRLGLENSPLLRAARSDANAAAEALRGVRNDRLPTLTTQAGYTRLSGNIPGVTFAIPGTDSTVTFQSVELDRYQAEVDVQQPLFTGFRLRNRIRAAEHDARASELREQQQRSDLAFDIRQAYWNLYRAIATRTALADALRRVDAHLAVVRARVSQGSALHRDLLAAETRRSEVELDRVEADNAVRVGQLELDRLIGLPLHTPVRLPPDVATDTTAPSPDAVAGPTPAGNPRLQALAEDAGALDAQIRASRSRRWPQVDLVGSYLYARPNQYFFLEQDRFHRSWQLGLSAHWDLWDGGRASAHEGQLKAQLDAAQARLADTRAKVSVQLARDSLEVLRARAAVRVATRTVREAQETYRVTQKQFEEGMALSTDVLDAEEAYRNAEERKAGALADYAIARAAVVNALGRVW